MPHNRPTSHYGHVATPHAFPTRSEIYGVDWPSAIKKEAKSRIRTEVGLKQRLNAQREIDDLTGRVMRRLDDCVGLKFMPELNTLAELQEFAKLSRKELFKLFGWNDDVSGVLETYAEKGN